MHMVLAYLELNSFFLDRYELPSEDEQYHHYKRMIIELYEFFPQLRYKP